MRTYTVTGLLDEDDGKLYVSASFPGRIPPAGDAERVTTFMTGYGELTRYIGYFDAASAAEAERLAVDIAAQQADDLASRWASNGADNDMA